MTADPIDLDQLDALRAAATPGPWHVAKAGGIDAGEYDTVIGRGDVDCMSRCYGGVSTIDGDNLDADAALIAVAITALPALVAELRAHRAAVAAVLAKCGQMETEAPKPQVGGFLAEEFRQTVTAAVGVDR